MTEIRIWSTVFACIIPGAVSLKNIALFFFLPDSVGYLQYSSHFSSCLCLHVSYSHQWDTMDVLRSGRVKQWLKGLLQTHPEFSGRFIWVKYLKSWKSLNILLNAHIHLELIAVPLVPCKSLRNAVEVWDLPQRDLEGLWTEKWRICLTFIHLTVLIYFYRETFGHIYIY